MEDNQIVDLFLRRDELAISHTARRYGSRLRRLSYAFVEDYQAAEECENDTYLQAWDSIPPHEPRNYFFAFLARIVRNRSIDHCRTRDRQKRSACITELTAELENCLPAEENLQQRLEGKELAEAIGAFLRSIPEQQRNVFLRRYWFGDSVSDICGRYLMGQSRVKSMLFRTRNGLRDYLTKEGYPL